MEMTSEFVQLFVDKLQFEIAEATKQRLFLLAQNEYLNLQLLAVKDEVEKLTANLIAGKELDAKVKEADIEDKQKLILLNEKG